MPDSATIFTTNRPETLSEVRLLLDQVRRDNVPFLASPVDWRDEVLYFLLPDRLPVARGDRRMIAEINVMLLIELVQNSVRIPLLHH